MLLIHLKILQFLHNFIIYLFLICERKNINPNQKQVLGKEKGKKKRELGVVVSRDSVQL